MCIDIFEMNFWNKKVIFYFWKTDQIENQIDGSDEK